MEAEGKALELVVFKLNEGVTREQFLAAAEDVSTWISTQPGFISRELSYDAEGDRWIEVVWWVTVEHAQVAARLAMNSTLCAPMFAAIDKESTLMLHGELAVTSTSR
jgi:hypothetical protein